MWALVTLQAAVGTRAPPPNTAQPGEPLSLALPTLEEWALALGPSIDGHPPSHPQPLAKRCRLQPRDAAKMPESAWKFLFYLGAWSYSAYLLFGTDYPFFHDPPSVFYGRGPTRQSWVGESSALHGGAGHSSHISCWMSTSNVAPGQGCSKGSEDREGSCLGLVAIRAQGGIILMR